MRSSKIDKVFIELITNLNGVIQSIVAGKFAYSTFTMQETIFKNCPYLEGTLEALKTSEPFLLEGMVLKEGDKEYNVDLELFKSNNEVSILIHNRTNVYKVVKELNQSRNDLFFLKREIIEKNKELIALRKIADKANEEKSRFLAMMSHEIRNPLNVILGYTELINKEKTPLQIQDYLKYLTISGQNLKVIVDDILDLSRVEAGKLLLINEPINIADILNQIEDNYKSNHSDLDIKLNFDVAKNLPKLVMGDNVRLIQILTNLINNSIKFTPRGSVTTVVETISVDENNTLIRFKVIDTGRGMTEEQAAKVFEEYQQNRLSDNRLHKGVGLGLAIVKRLVNEMKGAIVVESFLRYGTTISIDIPFKIATNSDLIEDDDRDSYEITSLKDKKILVADDNFLNLSIVSHILKKEAANYLLVKDGVEAMEAMEKTTFDIVLLDINMPNLSGEDLIKRKEKLQKSNTKIPFLAMTANNSQEDVEHYLKIGFVDVIPKPFTAIQFVEILKKNI
ncbi:MAG: ATP-binding protein [Polaribacter sp.]|uniref:ATP-binding response regulator n=1 Tax=Polaribacter sp. TaxID=1920175 RepID=UPI003BB0B9EE